MRPKIRFENILKIIIGKAVVFSAALFFLFYSCDEGTSTLVGSEKDSIPSTRLFNAHFNLIDSGYDKVTLRAPIVEMYELIDTPFTIFPKGLELNFFKKGASKPGFLRASYAKIIEKKLWYEARGNVIIINDEDDTLKTQKLFWNKKAKRIFTPDTTYIIRHDGSSIPSYGGMDASDDFKTFKFYNNNKGPIFVKDN